jgi:hypothetical protein
MLPIEKMKFNVRKLLHSKDKSQKITLSSDNNNKNNITSRTVASLPSLKDMEFNWMEDY